MKKLTFILTLLVSTVMFSSPSDAEPDSEHVFTFYRNSHGNPAMRIHVATFDAGRKDFNEWHCNKVIKYFRSDDHKTAMDAIVGELMG
jgi:hypothetical protein